MHIIAEDFNDRIFWIYFIITLFFIIIGMSAILTSDNPYLIIISILWFLSNVALMILIYHLSIDWGPKNSTNNEQICVADINSPCFNRNNRTWLLINILFIVILIFSVLWAGELRNNDDSPLRTISGILILLGGLILCGLTIENVYMFPFLVAISYLLIWFGLTLYVTI